MTFVFSFLAGILTAFSPCVLPALPLIVGSAAQEHRLAPLFVAIGLIISFTGVGFFLASSGNFLGFEGDTIRSVSAGAFILFGLVLLFPFLQRKFQALLEPIANFGNSRLASSRFQGLGGQLFLGVLLGAVWSPCVGPTLGAAISLASQGENLVFAAITMFVFSVGAALPLLFLAYGSRKIFLSHRGNALRAGIWGKSIFGGTLFIVGLTLFFGWDKILEARILEWLPDRWVEWISYF